MKITAITHVRVRAVSLVFNSADRVRALSSPSFLLFSRLVRAVPIFSYGPSRKERIKEDARKLGAELG